MLNTWFKDLQDFSLCVEKTEMKLDAFNSRFSALKRVGPLLEDIAIDVIDMHYYVQKMHGFVEILDLLEPQKVTVYKKAFIGLQDRFYHTVGAVRGRLKRPTKEQLKNENIKFFFEKIPTYEEVSLKNAIYELDFNYAQVKEQVKSNKSISRIQKEILYSKWQINKGLVRILDGSGSTFQRGNLEDVSVETVLKYCDAAKSLSKTMAQINPGRPDVRDVKLFKDYDVNITKRGLNKLIVDTYSILGEEVVEIVQNVLKKGVLTTKRKNVSYQAQFSHYECHPIICFSDVKTLDDIILLVHEVGHAVHSVLINQQCNYIQSLASVYASETFAYFFQTLFILRLRMVSNSQIDEESLTGYWKSFVIHELYNRAFSVEIEEMFRSEGHLDLTEFENKYQEKLEEYYPFCKISSKAKSSWVDETLIFDAYYGHVYLCSFLSAVNLAFKVLSVEIPISNIKEMMMAGSLVKGDSLDVTQIKNLINKLSNSLKV